MNYQRFSTSALAIFAATIPATSALRAQTDKPALSATGTAITISVARGARQRFGGFGTSLGNWSSDYQKLSAAERTTLSQSLWRDLKFKTLRLWLNTHEFAPMPGAHDLSIFRRMYVDSGIIADERKHGATTLLLAPDGLPPHMADKLADGIALKESEVGNYAVLLADFIQRLKQETGVTLDATGVQNEPNIHHVISPSQMVAVVKRLRTELDARGLRSVKIIAPEYASSDGVFYEQVDALKNDAQAWQALAGVSSHSYNMAATDDIARRIAAADGKNLKEYWMTEASENGPEEAGDKFRAASLASRFLNDMNHRVTHWIHFIGYEVTDPKDNATRIMAYTTNPLRTTIFQKYFTYRQLSNAFDVGAVFRDSQSTLDGDMTWTYGQKPRVTAASAQNPDGSWAIGLSNYTADSFLGVQGWSDAEWNKSQGGHTPGQRFPVTIEIEELKNRGAINFTVHRSNAAPNARAETVTMKNGQISVAVEPLELVTLRSAAVRK